MASTTYEAVGNKEDVSDIITNISPFDTPLHSRLGKTTATATYHEWLQDELGAARDNAFPEGFTFATEKVPARQRLGNYTQIMWRGIHVTGTQEVVAKHGLTSEMAYQMQKTLKELSMDWERALLTQDTREAGTTTDMTRKFGGLPYWIVTHAIDNGGTPRPLTFELINSALEEVWMDGGHPTILLVSPRSKRIISTFTAGSTKYMDGNKTRKLSQMIDVLETDFGTLQCVVDRHIPAGADVVYGLSTEYMKRAILRPFKQQEIPKLSDMERKGILGEWTLEMRAEKASFAIKDLDGIVPTE